ncbi:hypothetical protein ACH4UT_33870 [Streptomyces sp. NPDC020799]|uniref:hypothetical protein n=1 Tax=Streptomyces sp. NPDC020799 TaxID=3365091 RepID=UPI003791EF0D
MVSSAFEGNRSESHLIAERYFPFVGAINFLMSAEGFGLTDHFRMSSVWRLGVGDAIGQGLTGG